MKTLAGSLDSEWSALDGTSLQTCTSTDLDTSWRPVDYPVMNAREYSQVLRRSSDSPQSGEDVRKRLGPCFDTT